MSDLAYRRVLLKLSGEALTGDEDYGIDPKVISRLAEEVIEAQQAGAQIALVIGGGNIFRGAGLAKVVHSGGEDAKVAIRNIRRDANHQVKELLKEKQITEDDAARAEQDIQKLTDEAIKNVDEVVKAKEQELMAV